jgi:iron complex outermembrane recepter protein
VTRISIAVILPCCAIALAPAMVARADDPVPPGTPLQTATKPVAADDTRELPPIAVQATAIPGTSVDVDKVPGNVQTLRATDLSRDGPASLTRAMSSQLGSVNINDNLDDPFQPDIVYRGFEASPVLGTPQGLAVYQNGVRINEAFGDTVNWDLIPDMAISRVDIVSSNPVYGLNALGGGISVTMKNGFNYKGSEVELSGGSFGQRSVAAQYGVSSDQFGFYITGKALNADGWRMFSSDSLRQVYTALSARTERATIELSYSHADNQLNGQGAAPVQELAVDRSLVFTGPQQNSNKLDFLTLNGSMDVTPAWSVQSVLYYRHYLQTVANGNTTDYTACTNAANALCQSDGLTPITTASGAGIPDISNGGSNPIGENDFETIDAHGRGAALQTAVAERVFGHGNQFTAGATVDYSSVSFFSGAQVGAIDSQLLVQPTNFIVDTPESSPFGATPVSLQAVNKYYGLYATDTFDVTPDLSLTASGRYNVAYIDLQDQRGTSLTGDSRYSHFNPAFGGTYKVLPTMTAYAGVSQNTRTPTASEIECSNPLQPCLLPSNLAGDPPTLRQVVAHTYEFGLRGKLHDLTGAEGSGSWNLGAFRTQLDDDIYGVATSVSTGFFQNIGATRRQGIEAGLNYRTGNWSGYANYSYIDATFQSALTLPSPSNPFQDANGNIQVQPGNHLPGIPQNRLKMGLDYKILPNWTLGGTLIFVSSFYYFGDESNQIAPLPGYHVVNLHTSYRFNRQVELFAMINNLFDTKYANYGILSDPTGAGTPGVPADGVTNGPGVDNRFQSPAAPFAAFAGLRFSF